MNMFGNFEVCCYGTGGHELSARRAPRQEDQLPVNKRMHECPGARHGDLETWFDEGLIRIVWLGPRDARKFTFHLHCTLWKLIRCKKDAWAFQLTSRATAFAEASSRSFVAWPTSAIPKITAGMSVFGPRPA